MTPEQRIDIDRVRALWATASTSSTIATISAVVWFVVFYDQEGLATMLLISAIVVTNQAVRVLLAKRYAREADDPARTALWARRYTWTMVSGGLIWGLVSVYLFRSDDAARQVFILVCAYGNTAGATAPNAYHPPAMLWFIFATLVPVMGRVLMEPGLVYGFVNVALLMQLVFMSLFGLNITSCCWPRSAPATRTHGWSANCRRRPKRWSTPARRNRNSSPPPAMTCASRCMRWATTPRC